MASSKLSRELMPCSTWPRVRLPGGMAAVHHEGGKRLRARWFRKALDDITTRLKSITSISSTRPHTAADAPQGDVELNEAIRASILEPSSQASQQRPDEGLIEKVMKKEVDPTTVAEDIAKRYLRVPVIET